MYEVLAIKELRQYKKNKRRSDSRLLFLFTHRMISYKLLMLVYSQNQMRRRKKVCCFELERGTNYVKVFLGASFMKAEVKSKMHPNPSTRGAL